MIQIQHCESFEQMSLLAADTVCRLVSSEPAAHLCLATGASPLGLYRELASRVKRNEAELRSCQITKLDEWLGIPMDHPGSCESFLRNEVLDPWQIEPGRYLAFDSSMPDLEAECNRLAAELAKLRPIDLCVLGIGANGHLGLNEPADALVPGPHIATLAAETRKHAMIQDVDLQSGITLGVGDVMASAHVLLLIVGESKRTAQRSLLEGVLRTSLPASLLHLHPNVTCLSTL